MAERVGLPLMPWQRLVADVGGEIDPATGLPAYREVILTVPRQSGKDLGCSTPILTTAGWETMGTVEVGDEVYGPDGVPTPVTFTSEVFTGHRCYEVEFEDGAVILAGEDHLWWVWDKDGHDPARWESRAPGEPKPHGVWRTVSTAQIAGSRWGYRRMNGRMEYRYRVRCDAIVQSPPADLPVDPYVLGYWLGNGTTGTGRVTTGGWKGAQDVGHVVRRFGPAARVVRSEPEHHVATVHVTGLRVGLETLGVLGDKHIPDVYLNASPTQRRALLAGLVDSDGHISDVRKSPRIEYCTISKRLAWDVFRLVRSLGVKATLRENDARLYGRRVSSRYRICWTPTFNPFTLPRKAEVFHPPMTGRHQWMSIVGVREVPTVPTRCIQVAHPEHVFLVGELFTPTHNTTLVLGWELQRALGWGSPQRVVYSAQSGNDARKKLIDDQVPILEPRARKLGIRRILRGMGNEAVEFVNGSRISLLASTDDSGHGKTLDLGVKDELFADGDERRDQSMVPAMATRAAAQILTLSTMGTDDSVALNRAVDRGRAAVDEGARTGVAYFEWSAGVDDDPDDPATWWACMPALGHTITEDVVAHASGVMLDGEFRRAFLNQRTRADERIIGGAVWAAVCSSDARPAGRLMFGLDVNPERSSGAVVAASAAPVVAELVDVRPGTGWLTGRAAELDARHGPGRWVVEAGGPAGSLIPELVAAGLDVYPVTPRELVEACGQFYDAVQARTVTVRANSVLDGAVAAAAKRTVGDAWAWTRRNATGDVSPLVALTLAVWGARRPAAEPAGDARCYSLADLVAADAEEGR